MVYKVMVSRIRGVALPVLLSVLCLFVDACSHQAPFTRRGRSYPGLDEDAQAFLKKTGRGPVPSYDVPIVINDRVKWWIHHFRKDLHGRFNLYLSRSGRYEKFMRSILKEEGLPQDLIYVALIESGFSNHAYSRARAVGPWQFIQSTGKIFGLQNDGWVDERRDPEKATRAAANYLKRLYNEFGDWYLAMAGYNAGEGKIRRAIRNSGSNNFWEIARPGSRYLKWETQNYVPKFIAAALIAKNPERFGFHHVSYEEPLAFDVVSVGGPLDVEVASELSGADLEEVQRLNPELKMGMTPAGHYSLKIPFGRRDIFQTAYAKLPKEQRVRIVYHKVRRGESVSKIAKHYGVSVKSLLAANDMTQKQAHHLRAGKRLIISKRPSLSASTELSTRASGSSGVLLAYNDRPKGRKRVNGVEWLIKKDMGGEQQTVDPSTLEQATDQEKTEISAPVVDAEGMGSAALPEVEETDLGEVKSEKFKVKSEKNEGGTTEVSENQMDQLAKETETKPVVVIQSRSEEKVHVVRAGDNLWRLAKRYGVSIDKLKKWNKLDRPNQLRPGKKLVVVSQ